MEVAERLDPTLRKGDTQSAVLRRVSDIIRKEIPEGPYHKLLELDFTNDPKEVAAHIDGFIRAQKESFPVAAVYAEMNGFDINPDEWHFDLSDYRQYEGRDDSDWLSGWDSGDHPPMTLTGMEALQEVYAAVDEDEDEDDEHEDDDDEEEEDEAEEIGAEETEEDHQTEYFCSLLVMLKFQDLIRRSVPFMKELESPLLATAHEYVSIAEFRKQVHSLFSPGPLREPFPPALVRHFDVGDISRFERDDACFDMPFDVADPFLVEDQCSQLATVFQRNDGNLVAHSGLACPRDFFPEGFWNFDIVVWHLSPLFRLLYSGPWRTYAS